MASIYPNIAIGRTPKFMFVEVHARLRATTPSNTSSAAPASLGSISSANKTEAPSD
jgi:hypothetical protein